MNKKSSLFKVIVLVSAMLMLFSSTVLANTAGSNSADASASSSVNGAGSNLDVKMSFPDVGSSYWGLSYVTQMALLGVVQGDDKGNYNPNDPVTQEAAVTMVVRLMGLEQEAKANTTNFTSPFDVSTWAKPYIQEAINKGLLNLNDEVAHAAANGSWGKTDATREWVANLVIQAIQKKNEAASLSTQITSFSDDSQIDNWARGAINEAIKLNIVNGYAADNTFKPKGEVTRAEMATFLSRALQKLPNQNKNVVTGSVNQIDASTIQVTDNSGKATSYPMSPNAQLFNSKGRILVSDVKPSYKVSLVQRQGTVYYVQVTDSKLKLTSTSASFVGFHQDKQDNMIIEVAAQGQSQFFKLASNFSIVDQNGNGLHITSLATGDRLSLQSYATGGQSDVIKIVDIGPGVGSDYTLSGTVAAVLSSGQSITIQPKGQELTETMNVSSDALIQDDNQARISLSAVPVSASVQLFVSKNSVTSITVSPQSSSSSSSGQDSQSSSDQTSGQSASGTTGGSDTANSGSTGDTSATNGSSTDNQTGGSQPGTTKTSDTGTNNSSTSNTDSSGQTNNGSASEASGKVYSVVSADNSPNGQATMIITETNGDLSAFVISDNAAIMIPGIEYAQLSDVQIGDTVNVQLDNKMITDINVIDRSIKNSYLMNVVDYIPSRHYLLLVGNSKSDKPITYTLDDNTKITANGTEVDLSNFSSIFPMNSKVDIVTSNDKLISITKSSQYKGTIAQVDTSNHEITLHMDNGDNLKLSLPLYLLVQEATKMNATMNDLKAGQIVQVTLNSTQDQIATIQVQQTVLARVNSLDANQMGFAITDESGMSNHYSLADAKLVHSGEQSPSASELTPNTPVVVKFLGMLPSEVDILDNHYGKITAIDSNQHTMTIQQFDGTNVTISTSAGLTIHQNSDVFTSMNKLNPDERLEYVKSPDGQLDITIMDSEQKTVSSYDTGSHTLILLRRQLSDPIDFKFASDAYIHQGSQKITPNFLVHGDKIMIYMLDGKIMELNRIQ